MKRLKKGSIKIACAVLALASFAAVSPRIALLANASEVAGSRLVEWCRGSIGVLSDYANQSRLQMVDGNWNGALVILWKGLAVAQAEAGIDQDGQTLTKRALETGAEIANGLERVRATDEHGMEAAIGYLSSYYDFMIRVVGPLDSAFHIPYFHHRERHSPEAEYERQYQQFAERQITWLVDGFTVSTPNYGIVPKHSAGTYLKVLAIVAKSAASELDHSLWRARFSCAISQLNRLHARVERFNSGNRSEYSTDRRAVNSATGELLQITESLRGGCR